LRQQTALRYSFQTFSRRLSNQSGRPGIVNHGGNRPFKNAFYRFINHMQRRKEPFFWLYRIAEAVVDGQVEPGGRKDTMKDVLQSRAVDSESLYVATTSTSANR